MSTTPPDRPTTVDSPSSAGSRAPSDPEHLSDSEYRALAEFRHALRVFLRFSEDQRRQLVTLSPEGSACLARLSEMHREELRRFRTEAADLLAELR